MNREDETQCLIQRQDTLILPLPSNPRTKKIATLKPDALVANRFRDLMTTGICVIYQKIDTPYTKKGSCLIDDNYLVIFEDGCHRNIHRKVFSIHLNDLEVSQVELSTKLYDKRTKMVIFFNFKEIHTAYRFTKLFNNMLLVEQRTVKCLFGESNALKEFRRVTLLLNSN